MGDRVAVMNRGVLQQVDAPQDMYERPTNLFVAGFIGSPAMNMVAAVGGPGRAGRVGRVRRPTAEAARGDVPAAAARWRATPVSRWSWASGPRTWRTRSTPLIASRTPPAGRGRYPGGDGLRGVCPLQRRRAPPSSPRTPSTSRPTPRDVASSRRRPISDRRSWPFSPRTSAQRGAPMRLQVDTAPAALLRPGNRGCDLGGHRDGDALHGVVHVAADVPCRVRAAAPPVVVGGAAAQLVGPGRAVATVDQPCHAYGPAVSPSSRGAHERPPSVRTSTAAIRPRPDQARPITGTAPAANDRSRVKKSGMPGGTISDLGTMRVTGVAGVVVVLAQPVGRAPAGSRRTARRRRRDRRAAT